MFTFFLSEFPDRLTLPSQVNARTSHNRFFLTHHKSTYRYYYYFVYFFFYSLSSLFLLTVSISYQDLLNFLANVEYSLIIFWHWMGTFNLDVIFVTEFVRNLLTQKMMLNINNKLYKFTGIANKLSLISLEKNQILITYINVTSNTLNYRLRLVS